MTEKKNLVLPKIIKINEEKDIKNYTERKNIVGEINLYFSSSSTNFKTFILLAI